jgi:hypothetical protein
LLLLDRGVKSIEVCQIGDIALNASHVLTDLVYSSIKFSLTTTRDKDIGTFSDKSFSSGKSDAAGATRNESDFA